MQKVRELKAQLRKSRNELQTFYEITQAMRSTLNFDEILYIILTGITSHHGLGFNRAVLFSVDYEKEKIKGIMGIGPYNVDEAKEIWEWIEKEKKSLDELIAEYRWIKKGSKQSKFLDFVKSLEVPFSEKAGVVYRVCKRGAIRHIKKGEVSKLKKDWLYNKLSFSEAVLVPLWMKKKVGAVLFVDNFVTKKKINKDDLNILKMFASEAALAIENSRMFEETLSKAHTDSLTGLWNHGYFQYQLEEQIGHAKRNKSIFSLLMVDIDDFKKYNDEFGHLAGDKALIKVGSVIEESCRKEDIVCRYGGEEFVVILPNILKKDAFRIAKRIRDQVEGLQDYLEKMLTVSIGISFFPSDSFERRPLINKADKCLYEAKKTGKNKVASA